MMLEKVNQRNSFLTHSPEPRNVGTGFVNASETPL